MMQVAIKLFPLLIAHTVLQSCQVQRSASGDEPVSYYSSHKPYTRWWWFATKIEKSDIKYQLDWLRANNFGGVEIAWMYPLYRYNALYSKNYGRTYAIDSSAQEWLSPELSEVVAYTKSYADSIGLGCDLSFGSTWHLGDSHVPTEDWTRIYSDSNFEQTITFSWEYPAVGHVINHLDSNALYRLSQRLGPFLSDAFRGTPSALFADSWEIKLNFTNKIWTGGFEEMFLDRFGYDIIPYMDTLDSIPDVRYDYMMLLSDQAIENLYKPFTSIAHRMGGFSRVQCLASPTDVMTAYSTVDVPETEAMLNKPDYSRIVSSSAALASKDVVSAEAFTCMYGFPGTYLRKEQTADLKLVADALFAQGVNQVFYHGMPYNPEGVDSIDFFATVYVGPNGSLTEELSEFNDYMTKVSRHMRRGRTYSDVAVYIPFEDAVMAGEYPPERRRVWVWGQYEMRYVSPPPEVEGYHPLWINRYFLEQSTFDGSVLRCGELEFSLLYVDVEFMDHRALSRIIALAQQGLQVCIKRRPREPGMVKTRGYQEMVSQLLALDNVSSQFQALIDHEPLVQGDSLPDYWSRVDGGDTYVFFSNPFAKDLSYPIYSGQSWSDSAITRLVTLTVSGKPVELNLVFDPYQSLLVKVDAAGQVTMEDIKFVPKDPVVRPKEPQKTYF
jgi:hypothetical protein